VHTLKEVWQTQESERSDEGERTTGEQKRGDRRFKDADAFHHAISLVGIVERGVLIR
jgi:hypothetical protein